MADDNLTTQPEGTDAVKNDGSPTWRCGYSEEHLQTIDLYNQICVPHGWWPVDRFSAELQDALEVITAGSDAEEITEMLTAAVRERNSGDPDYNKPKGNKLIRILWSNYRRLN